MYPLCISLSLSLSLTLSASLCLSICLSTQILLSNDSRSLCRCLFFLSLSLSCPGLRIELKVSQLFTAETRGASRVEQLPRSAPPALHYVRHDTKRAKEALTFYKNLAHLTNPLSCSFILLFSYSFTLFSYRRVGVCALNAHLIMRNIFWCALQIIKLVNCIPLRLIHDLGSIGAL